MQAGLSLWFTGLSLRRSLPQGHNVSQTSIPSRYLATLLENLRQRDVDVEAIMKNCGIPLDAEGNPRLPDQVPAELYTRIYQHYQEGMHDEHFAFSSSSGNVPGKYRMLCIILAECELLGEGLRRAQDFYRSFGSGPGAFELRTAGDQVALELSQDLHIAPSRQPVVAANILIAIKRTLEHLVGRDLPLSHVELKGAQPSRPGKYEQLFGAPVQYSASRNALVFHVDTLELAVVHTPESVLELVEQIPGLLFQPTSAGAEGLSEKVLRLLGHDLSRGMPSQEEVARLLDLSTTSLRRRLAAEGTNYQQLKQRQREQLARQLLQDSRLSLAEIATRLGFPATSALHRAFRKWTGMTPGQYRASVHDAGNGR